ncbi:hypothetical protein D7V86_02025 [bacterium D16-51]|nr:hypothetical protein D7V96_01450 [bacterium D16-59]RKI62317.1 hypothetical protein D7V86_02025 [bacterium D16-51]
MGVVLYTQRVEVVESYEERRDCADQKIAEFICACGFLPVPLPNIREIVVKIFRELKPSGIVLTGGNSLVKYGGNAPERDEMEWELIKLSIKNEIPVYGFCRGMQVVLDYFNCDLEEIPGHVIAKHKLRGIWEGEEVNSFHNQACMQVKEPLQKLAWTEDGIVEAVACKKYRILGTMWHPERNQPFRQEDIARVKAVFGKGEMRL